MTTTLVLLPGLAGDATMWRDQLNALAAWQPRVSEVHMHHDSIDAMAAALLREVPGELALCGASMGGMVAMEAARQAPGRIRGLALLGTTARPESEDMRRLREDAVVLFEQGRIEEVIAPNAHFAFHPAHAQDPELMDAYLRFVLRAGGEQLARQNRAVMRRPDAREHLRAVRCPVLVMCGADDQLTPVECSREIAALAPHADLRVLARCGHMLTMEQPGAVNAGLLEWLAGLPLAPARA
ncbi:alpha/beta hydrolase [Ramlibacter sp. AN1015]|uniref:alpha/beta fold hydrolase n=1 Tax=Ramlibacter sp. AN1015 TaxID=3133428 RepID=UPI0030C035FE